MNSAKMRMKKRMNGKRTRSQDNHVAPAAHIKLRIHVQNNMYMICANNTRNVLDTSHVYDPTQ